MTDPASRHLPDEPQSLHARMGVILGVPVQTDSDLAALVLSQLPLGSLEAMAQYGLSYDEIFALVVPRRTFAHRKTNRQPLTREESDKAVRVARLCALAEMVFGNRGKALRWMRKPKRQLEARTPLDELATDAGARLVEEMLYRIDEGMAA